MISFLMSAGHYVIIGLVSVGGVYLLFTCWKDMWLINTIESEKNKKKTTKTLKP